MKLHLWICYDYASSSEYLSMLGRVMKQYPNRNISHEIDRPMLLQATLEGVAIVLSLIKASQMNQNEFQTWLYCYRPSNFV